MRWIQPLGFGHWVVLQSGFVYSGSPYIDFLFAVHHFHSFHSFFLPFNAVFFVQASSCTILTSSPTTYTHYTHFIQVECTLVSSYK